VLDASVQIGIGQRAGHSRAQYMGRRKLSDQSGGTVEQRPAGDGEIKARLGASGGGRSRHHCYCWPGRPYTLVVTEGRRRRRGGTRPVGARQQDGAPAEAVGQPGHRQSSDSARCRDATSCWSHAEQSCALARVRYRPCRRVTYTGGDDAAFHARYEDGMGIKVKKRKNDTARSGACKSALAAPRPTHQAPTARTVRRSFRRSCYGRVMRRRDAPTGPMRGWQ
jgi:hypothetical protein